MPSNISLSDRAKAVEAMRKREILRKTTSFQDWLPQVTPKFTWTWKHLLLIFKALNDVATGKTKRLMIFMPPRSGKSEAVTVRFPAWMIERNPELRFIVAAYNVSLASKFSRKTQRIVSARGIELDREAVDDWTTNKEGGIRAVGVGSGVTGHGANGILIDDPIKPLAIDTPVPTPSGWKMLGDLQIGDKVFDHTGCICNIINVTPHYTAPRMRVTFSDNSTIDAHPSHPWKAFSRDDHAIYTQKYKNYDSLWPTWKSNGKAKVQTVTTSHIAATLTARITMRNWTIPVCGALELPEAVLPIDPYLLGYWLGDGTSAEAAVTVGNKDVPHFLSHIMAIGYVIHSDKANDKGAHRISVSTTYRKQNKWGDSLTRRLRELGVLNNKHIPGIYLRASIQQRLALLRGLMDSDGTIEKTYGETTFVSTSKPLADGTHELIVSLGGKVVVSTRPAANKTAYILRGFYTFQPFALPRKAQRNTAPGQIRRRNRTIVNVEKLDNCEHVCITVDSDSHLFLAGKGMIPVCNSKEEAYSVVYRDKAWEWYKDDLYTRLEPNGFIILTLCMTGDTRVLMADGSEKLLVNINIGDEIATYEDGQLTTSTVRNWKNQGYDNTLTIALASGITVRANERHPFLVSRNGGTEWIRLKELVAGDKIVRVMARTKGLNVQSMDVKNLQSVEGNVHPITARHCGQVGIGRRDLVPSQEGQYDCA